MRRRRCNPFPIIAVLCILTGFWLLGSSWIAQVTAPGSPPHALWRASLPGYDVGLDTWPAAPARTGYIELWYYPHRTDDIRPVLQLFGRPALPLPERPNAPVAPSLPRELIPTILPRYV
jgi:hypothetical protein